jgi:hypothetical protein
MNCGECGFKVVTTFNFCPECGNKLQTNMQSTNRSIPERYLPVISEYESLTNTKLSELQKLRFIESPPVGQLSVNVSERRVAAAKQVMKSNSDGTFKLDVLEWAKAMYELKDPQANPSVRVWMTSGGDKYHSSRDCKGLVAGQSFASWKGKETYKPQYVPLRDAAWVLGKVPCEVCKPKKWEK